MTARSSRALIDRLASLDPTRSLMLEIHEVSTQLSRLESVNSVRWGHNEPSGTPISTFRDHSHQCRAASVIMLRDPSCNRG